MPTYEYECPSGHRYEKREGFDAPAKQRCATCRRTARRVLHAPPIVFKGSGFYVTDSRKPASNGAEGSTPASDSGSKGESAPAAADAKPESTPAAGDSKKDTKRDAEPAAAG